MEYIYKTQDTCSSAIKLNIDGNVVTNISFTGGCNGNLKALAKACRAAYTEQEERRQA